MPERTTPENYFSQGTLQETPYVIPMPVWIIIGLAVILSAVGLITVSLYALKKK